MIKNLIEKNKIILIKLLLLIVWVFLFLLNYITINRLIRFVIILVIIYIYKQVINLVKKIQPIKNINLLLLLMYIDWLKLVLVYLIEIVYIWLFDLLTLSNENIIIKILERVIKSLLINPLLMIMFKFYYILYIWLTSSFKDIFLNRFYGMILGVLIFSPILLNIYKLLNYSILNIYILIVIISIVEDSYKMLKKYKNIKLIKYILLFINLLKINKDLSLILEYRNRISILSILIRKSVDKIKEINSKVNIFAYNINYIYKNVLLLELNELNNNYLKKYIIDYNIKLQNIKVMNMKISLVKGYNSLFQCYCHHIDFILYDNLCTFTNIIYYKLQQNYILKNIDIVKLNKIEEILYLLVKLILFYYWNVFKLMGFNDSTILEDLEIISHPYSELKYNRSKFYDLNDLNDLGLIIKNEDFYSYKDFYERMYIYIHLWNFYYYDNLGINYNKYNKYKNIFNYINIFKSNLEVISQDKIELIVGNYRDYMKLEDEINKKLIELKNKWIMEWQIQSVNLSIENFYNINNLNLIELDNWIKQQLEEEEKKKK